MAVCHARGLFIEPAGLKVPVPASRPRSARPAARLPQVIDFQAVAFGVEEHGLARALRGNAHAAQAEIAVALAGAREVWGLNAKVNGPLDAKPRVPTNRKSKIKNRK